MRFSVANKRLDAHCRRHKNCKQDKVLSKQPIGLQMAWLQLGMEPYVDRKEAHAELKKHVRDEAFLDDRRAGRNKFSELASGSDPIYKEVIDLELHICGVSEEPKNV